MRSSVLRLIAIALISAPLGLGLLAPALTPDALAASVAPSFSLRDLTGRTHTLAQYKGKVVVLSFWATWCGPCQVEMPHLQKIHTDLGAQGLVLLGISADDAKSAAMVPNIVKAKGLTYPILLDTNSTVVASYNPAKTLPYTAIIDRTGALVQTHAGYNPGDEVRLREELTALLGQTAP